MYFIHVFTPPIRWAVFKNPAMYLCPRSPPSSLLSSFPSSGCLPSFLLLLELTESLRLIKYMNNVNLNQWGPLICDDVTVAISVVSDAHNTLEVDSILADIVGFR